MALRKARILSSENDASMRNNQHQTTNVNIKLPEIKKDSMTSPIRHNVAQGLDPVQSREVLITEDYPSVSPLTNDNNTAGVTPEGIPIYPTQEQMKIQELQEREIELTENIDDLEVKNQFLELLLQVYENNPIKLNSYLICKSSTLMEMIKLLTNCDKVDLVLDDNIGCTGCVSKNKYTYVSKILVTKNNKTEDLKYAYNDIYSKFVQHGISLKVVI